MLKKFLGLIFVLCLFATPVFAATVDLSGSHSIPWSGEPRCYVVYNDVTLSGVANGDVVQCLDIPAKTFVFDVFVKVLTPITVTAGTATVGDGAGAASWDASTDMKAAANTMTHGASGTDAYATSGKYYSDADTIDLVCSITDGPITAGKIRVFAICSTLE